LNQELLRSLEAVEKEKNLNRSFMMDILKTGLLSAIRKMYPNFDDYDIQIDPMTADIKVFQKGVEIYDAAFSRIAAQTAKQVIFQKLKEAEREAIYKEFSEKVGDIITGEVHRIEGNNIIVSLGDVEAVIPRREQVYQEDYRQGDYIKAYVVEVRKSYRGPDIILSRTHPFFVKRLFEIEVPEIGENIVEVKGVVREAGMRTKIAVVSRDEKVDCVGSCVGMRGQRVKISWKNFTVRRSTLSAGAPIRRCLSAMPWPPLKS
jgi:N utilization substance protein A